MAKVLNITVSGEGHINPTIPLLSELVDRGEEIVCYSLNDFQEKIEKTGAEFRSIDKKAQQMLGESAILSATQPIEYLLQFLSAMEKIMDSILNDISKEYFDYILYDAQSLPGKWVAHQRKLLSIATWTTVCISNASGWLRDGKLIDVVQFRKQSNADHCVSVLIRTHINFHIR